jgi:hypothetical protein
MAGAEAEVQSGGKAGGRSRGGGHGHCLDWGDGVQKAALPGR